MHSIEDCVCGNSVFNRKMELTQSASLASCSSQVLGRLPSPAVNAARWERHSHLSSPRYAGKEHCQKPRQGKGGEVSKMDLAEKTQVTGSVTATRESGITLILKNGHCQIKWCIIAIIGLYVVTY